MFCRFDRLTAGGSLLLLLVALGANGVVGDNAKIIPIQTTPLPPAAAPHAAAKLPPLAATGKPDAAVAKIVTKPPVLAAPGPITTIKPAAAHVNSITSAPVAAATPFANAVHPVTTAPVAAVAPAAGATDSGPAKKLAQYFEPICTHLDKLTNEHMFKAQAQLKSFIEKTAGKMSICFMQHYLMDPNLTPLDKVQLKTICSSQTLAADNKNSFKSFQACSVNNWDKNLDTELDRIIKLRLNCFFNHSHSKHDSTISLVHESDEMSIIGEVVGKMFSDNKSAGNSNITMINLGVPPAVKPAGPPANNAAPSVAPNNQAAANSQLLNDPNTVLVIVNDTPTSGPAATNANLPAAPAALRPPPPPPAVFAGPALPALQLTSKAPAAATAAAPASTLKPALLAAVASAAPAAAIGLLVTVKPVVTVKPAATVLGEKIVVAATTGAPKPPATTSTPKTNVSLTTPSATLKLAIGLALSTSKPAAVGPAPAASSAKPPASTMKPAGTTLKPAGTTSKPAGTTSKPAGTTSKPAGTTSKPAGTTSKPATGLATGKPASTGAPATSKKPPAAGATKAAASTSKPQTTPAAGSTGAPENDKKEAKDAIKSLQAQRANHVSDARLHQLEHERQMAIDPEGHSDKHKKYEQMKQQRTSKAPGSTAAPATTTAAPTTKKP